jgi:hypothetical protein
MRSDNIQVLALAIVIVAAAVIALTAWSMIPDNQPSESTATPTPEPTVNDIGSVPVEIDNSTGIDATIPDDDYGQEIDSQSSAPEGMPSSIVKYTDGKLGSVANSNGTADWNQLIESDVAAKIGYNRMSWDNVFYNNQYGGGNLKLQVTMAFTDGSGWDCQRNRDGIGYHGTWAPTTTTWVITSESWNPRWTLGVTHSYSADFTGGGIGEGPTTTIAGLHYKTYE